MIILPASINIVEQIAQSYTLRWSGNWSGWGPEIMTAEGGAGRCES